MFLNMKDQTITQLEDKRWIQDLEFAVNVTEHLTKLNLKLQGKKRQSLICIIALNVLSQN